VIWRCRGKAKQAEPKSEAACLCVHLLSACGRRGVLDSLWNIFMGVGTCSQGIVGFCVACGDLED